MTATSPESSPGERWIDRPRHLESIRTRGPYSSAEANAAPKDFGRLGCGSQDRRFPRPGLRRLRIRGKLHWSGRDLLCAFDPRHNDWWLGATTGDATGLGDRWKHTLASALAMKWSTMAASRRAELTFSFQEVSPIRLVSLPDLFFGSLTLFRVRLD